MTIDVPKGLDVSRETFERLDIYAKLLAKWNPAINLVSKSSLPDAWSRHIVDSLQVYRIGAPGFSNWADLGSGGGFPGMVAAICAMELSEPYKITLVESDVRKATFLRTVLRETGAIATVIADRIEGLTPLNVDVLSARALASLPSLLDYTALHLSPEGFALFSKGTSWRNELELARRTWQFDCEVIKSITSPDAVILKIKGLKRA